MFICIFQWLYTGYFASTHISPSCTVLQCKDPSCHFPKVLTVWSIRVLLRNILKPQDNHQFQAAELQSCCTFMGKFRIIWFSSVAGEVHIDFLLFQTRYSRRENEQIGISRRCPPYWISKLNWSSTPLFLDFRWSTQPCLWYKLLNCRYHKTFVNLCWVVPNNLNRSGEHPMFSMHFWNLLKLHSTASLGLDSNHCTKFFSFLASNTRTKLFGSFLQCDNFAPIGFGTFLHIHSNRFDTARYSHEYEPSPLWPSALSLLNFWLEMYLSV